MMSRSNGAERLAQSFNSWAREGREMMDGADSGAIEELLRANLDDDPGGDFLSDVHFFNLEGFRFKVHQ